MLFVNLSVTFDYLIARSENPNRSDYFNKLFLEYYNNRQLEMLTMSPITKMMMAISMAILLSMPQLSMASRSSNVALEEPSAMAMTGDLLIARPIGLAVTVVGVAAFLVSLPFSLLGGNSGEAAKTLVVGPAKTTFVRCLGCTQPGYKQSTEEVSSEEDE